MLKKIIGVIGGIGPEATYDFFGKILANTRVEREQDHIRLLIDNNPQTPDRNASLTGAGPSCAPSLIAAARNLERAGADILAMPCNTAHAYADEISRATSIPLLHIVDETCAAVRRKFPQARRVGVLAADGCRKARLYDVWLERHGLSCVNLGAALQKRCMEAIYSIKEGRELNAARATLAELAEQLANQGAEALIAGCTEIPMALENFELRLPVVDSTLILARRCVETAAPKRLRLTPDERRQPCKTSDGRPG